MKQTISLLCGEAVRFHQGGDLVRAEQIYLRAIAAEPQAFYPRYLLGVLRFHAGRAAEALALVSAALERHGDAEAFNIQGLILDTLGRALEALVSLDSALALEPNNAEAWNNRGNVLQKLGRTDEALQSLDKAVALAPAHAQGWNNHGVALRQLGRFDTALDSMARSLEIEPRNPHAWNNHGLMLHALNRLDEALTSYDRATALDAGYAEAWWNKSLCTLLQGRLDEGLALYEWRKMRNPSVAARAFAQPAWQGEDISGKTLFVYSEQGLGDTLQFCRYAVTAAERGARVVLSVQDPLLRLLQRLPGVTVVGSETVPEQFDCHAALLSLPRALGIARIADIPATPPYLRADPARVARWRATLGSAGFKVGIGWQGLPHGSVDLGRSFALAKLAPLARIPGVRLISLQKNAGSEQLDHLPPGMRVERLDGRDDGPDAFLDTAAVMESLDLVVTSDTAIAHLAGALGLKVWVALQHVPDWRWFLDRDESPWYPSMTLFRQPARGDWLCVFAEIARRLVVRAG
jgi:tetratricopeptide (TPR) repeat protein